MPLTDILIRSICGYLFILPGAALYFLHLKRAGKRQQLLHIAAVFVFCYYLIGVLTMTGIGRLKAFAPRVVLIPFRDMVSGPIDTVLNIILFVPLGFFLPLLYRKYSRLGSIASIGFLFSLSIEIVQMFGRGATDINDLITNTAGACPVSYTHLDVYKRQALNSVPPFRSGCSGGGVSALPPEKNAHSQQVRSGRRCVY